MFRCLKAVWFVVLGGALATYVVCAQVPEKRPSPAPSNDGGYTSPGPKKCVEVGNFYLKRGNLSAARSRFDEALKDDAHYAPAYLGLGKVYEGMKQKQKALQAYQRYLEELPSSQAAADAKDAQRAVARLQKELNPSAPPDHH